MECHFRKATFGGFHRQDVVDYLEATTRQHSQQVQGLEAQVQELEAQVAEYTALQEERDSAQATVATLEAEVAQLRASLETLEGEKSALDQEVTHLRSQTTQLQGDAEAYRDLKSRAAGIEVEAHLRAQRASDQAHSQVMALRGEAQAWVNHMAEEYAILSAKADNMARQATDNMAQSQVALESMRKLMGKKAEQITALRDKWAEETREAATQKGEEK